MVAPRTYAGRGVFKGRPRRFVRGHQGKAALAAHREELQARARYRLRIVKVRAKKPIPFCACGCGQRLAARGRRRYVEGHAAGVRFQPVVADRWREEDRGYVTLCWVWTGRIDHHGYGRLKRAGRDLKAHRVSYEQRVGPIPVGCELHHKCEVKPCVNPAHLQTLTPEAHKALHEEARRAAC